MKKVYWVQLLNLVLHLCKYMQANNNKLPTELKQQANTLLTSVEAFCLVLQVYDTTHARGRGV